MRGKPIKNDVGQEPIRKTVKRHVDSKPITIEIKKDLFRGTGKDSRFLLSIDGFTRRDKDSRSRKRKRRPAIPIQPETHFRLEPDEVTRSTRRQIELKVYNLPDNLRKDDVYEGVLWATNLSEKGPGERRLVTTIELTIA